MMEYFDIRDEIKEAIQQLLPIVVIESTIWVHGLPEKNSISALNECFRLIREEGAIPVVVALSGGRIKVGVTIQEITEMIINRQAKKVNLRDIATCLQKKEEGATTVSATIFIAHKLGLPVVATGGIGGVHRQAEKSYDISSDLLALATHPVAVVSSGIKSVLNIGATLEIMETLGIPIIGYRTDVIPAFYCNTSAYPAPDRMDNVEEIAGMLRIRQRMGMSQGVLIANPIPQKYSLNESLVEEVVEKSLLEANELMILGKDVTPFLLERLHSLTGGKTVQANVALIAENCRLGAKLAKFLYY